MSSPKSETNKLLEVYAHIDENGQYHFLSLPDAQIDEEDAREPERDWFKGPRLAPAGFRDIETFDFNSKVWKAEGKRSTARSLRRGKHYEYINNAKQYSEVEYHARAWIQARASETYEESCFNPPTQKIGGPIGKSLTIVLVDLSKKPGEPDFVVGELFLPWQRSFWPDWHKDSNLKTVNALEYIHNKDLADTNKAQEAIEKLSKAGIDIEKLKRGDEQSEMAARLQLTSWRREALSKVKHEEISAGILKLELEKEPSAPLSGAGFTPLRTVAQSASDSGSALASVSAASAAASASDQSPELQISIDISVALQDKRDAEKKTRKNS